MAHFFVIGASIPPRASRIVLATDMKAWYYTRHMKRFGHIACACSVLLLGSCTLTQPDSLPDADTPPALSSDESKQDTATPGKKSAPKSKREKKIEQALTENTADETKERIPQLFSIRGRRGGRIAQQDEAAEKANEKITPTKAQQKAAIKLLATQDKPKPKPSTRPRKRTAAAPPVEESDLEQRALPGSVLGGTLRSRRFAPPEEYDSSNDDDAPLPNSVEMRGFRSPVLRGRLPMDLSGKMIKED